MIKRKRHPIQSHRSLRTREDYLALDSSPDVGRKVLQSYQIFQAMAAQVQAPYSVEQHSSPTSVILLTHKGSGFVSRASQQHSLPPNTFCVLPAGSAFRYWTDRSWTLSTFHLMAGKLWGPFVEAFFSRPMIGCQDIGLLIRQFLNERERNRRDSIYLLDSLARTMSLLLERELSSRDSGVRADYQERLEGIRLALFDEPGHPWTVASLAAKFGFSPRNLLMLVHRHFGTSITELIAKARLERAAVLLRSGKFKIEDVAGQVGYQNTFAFSRAFKRYWSNSPKNYRELQIESPELGGAGKPNLRATSQSNIQLKLLGN
jgi:AraC-like DNA-binding protein